MFVLARVGSNNGNKTVRTGLVDFMYSKIQVEIAVNAVLAEESERSHSTRGNKEKRIHAPTLRRERCNHQWQNKQVLQLLCTAQHLETTPHRSRPPLFVVP
jgi:hypothetical protein